VLWHSGQGIRIPWCMPWRAPKQRPIGPPRPTSPGPGGTDHKLQFNRVSVIHIH
jgi:hypothetical protein